MTAMGVPARAPESWVGRRLLALRRVLPFCGLVVLPVVLQVMMLAQAGESFAVDFEQTFLPAVERLVAGESPYPAYGYPPLVVFALSPFAFLPAPGLVFVVVLALAVPLSLWLLGVRDWRVFGAVFLWAPVFHGLQTANVTLLLLLGLAAAWRYRERTRAVAAAGGLTIAAKIISWPLVVWLAATRRVRSAVATAAVAAGVTFGLWATLGFSGLVGYPSSMERLSGEVSPGSYTVKALAVDAGLGEFAGSALMAAVAGAALVGCIALGRRGDDRRSYAFAVLAVVVASPIVWLHSFALLIAPLALARPRFSRIWLAPGLLWVASGTGNGAPWQTALVLGVAAVVFFASIGVLETGARGRPGAASEHSA